MQKILQALLFFLILFALQAKAQNYNPIVSGNTSLFQQNFGGDYAFHIDSITIDPKGTAYHFLKTWDDLQNDQCLTSNQPIWTGSKCIANGKTYYFFNKDNDTITFKPNGELNSTWTVYKYPDGKYLEGKITDKRLLTHAIGFTDSVKTVTLQLKSSTGDIINNAPTGMEYYFSKDHGITMLTSPYDFPVVENIYYLNGMSNPKLGKQFLTPRTIFDFSIGDEFHYEIINSNPSYSYTNTKMIDEIIGIAGSVDGPQVTYTYKRRQEIHSQQAAGSPEIISYITDTITITQTFDDVIYYPQQAIKETNPLSFYYGMSSYNQGSELNSPTGFTYFNSAYDGIANTDGCWHYMVITANTTLSFVKGCGLTYRYMPNDIGQVSTQLVYYKKGEQEWGAPLLLSTYTQAKNKTISLYPNPLLQGDPLHIESDNFNGKQLSIYNHLGVQVYLSNDMAQNTIVLSELKAGMYTIQLINEKNEMLTSKLLIK